MNPFDLLFVICHVQYYERKRPIFFALERLPFFSKICVSNNILSPKKCFYIFPSECEISLWTLWNCLQRFVILDNTRENWLRTFVIVKTAVFWKISFYRPFRSYRKKFITCRIIVKSYCEPFWFALCHLSCAILWEKMTTFFCTGKIAFFQSFVFSTTS